MNINRKITICSIIVILTLSIFLCGCTEPTTLDGEESTLIPADRPRIDDTHSQESPVANDTGTTPEGTYLVVIANNQFAFDLYSKYKSEEGNIFFSPYSISTALAMTYEGARGKTAEEMQSVFHFPQDENMRKPAFAKIYNDINKKDKPYKLSTANALWAQKDYSFLEEYTTNIETYYGGKVTNLDFVKESEKSTRIINTWVEDQTNNKIKDLIPQGALNALTRLVLTNAIYFKGTWVKQFDEKYTHEANFNTDLGETLKTPMMQLTGEESKFNYAKTDELQILEMPYNGNDLSFGFECRYKANAARPKIRTIKSCSLPGVTDCKKVGLVSYIGSCNV